MLKRSIAILTVIVGFFLLLLGCSKNNHDVLVLLGDESYLKSIDEIYPKNYREEWPVIAPNYYHFNNENEVVPKLNEGLFPPDMTGDYNINFHYINGTFMVDFNGVHINVPGSDRQVSFKISDQTNSIADFEFNINGRSYPVENVFIYGNVDPEDSTKAEYSICFEYSEEYGEYNGNPMSLTYGCVITGVLENGVAKNGRYWILIKNRYPVEETNYSYILGGQQLYVAVN